MVGTFAYTITGSMSLGDKTVVYGTFTCSSSNTGGDIVTGLAQVDFIDFTATGAAVMADEPSVDETLPCGGTVTIVTTADATGLWMAYGSP